MGFDKVLELVKQKPINKEPNYCPICKIVNITDLGTEQTMVGYLGGRI